MSQMSADTGLGSGEAERDKMHPKQIPSPGDTPVNMARPNRIHLGLHVFTNLLLIYLRIYLFCFSRATHVAYGSSQASDQIRAVAAGLRHSHSNARSEPCL